MRTFFALLIAAALAAASIGSALAVGKSKGAGSGSAAPAKPKTHYVRIMKGGGKVPRHYVMVPTHRP